MKYLIIGDSSTNFSPEECKKYNAKMTPLNITIDDKEYVDNENINVQEFINDMNKSNSVPKSACPSSQSYIDLFEDDLDGIFIITLSSALSGSYNSAVLATNVYKESHPDAKIHVFDSKSAGSSQYLIARKLHDLIEKNLSFEEIVKEGEKFRDETQLLFILDKIDVFEKSGRISFLKSKLAQALNFKIILKQNKDGQVGYADKTRGSKKAIIKMVKSMSEYKKILPNNRIAILHCNALEKAELTKEHIELCYGKINEILIIEMYALNSTYAQEGGILLAF